MDWIKEVYVVFMCDLMGNVIIEECDIWKIKEEVVWVYIVGKVSDGQIVMIEFEV